MLAAAMSVSGAYAADETAAVSQAADKTVPAEPAAAPAAAPASVTKPEAPEPAASPAAPANVSQAQDADVGQSAAAPARARTVIRNQQAQQPQQTQYDNSYETKYFDSVQDVPLSADELNALRITQRWSAKASKSPLPARDGGVSFVYGMQPINIVCSPLNVTDIELEPGETVNTIHVGDSARWLIEPAITGGEGTSIQHLIVKPLDAGIKTSMVVTTNVRTYHINLKAHATRFMPQVSFAYPEKAYAKLEAAQQQAAQARAANTIPETGEYLGNLDFNYEIDGDDASWKPLRVYNNGSKTIIQLPKSVQAAEAPALLVMRDGSKTENLVNYRLIGDRYIVDSVFDQAVLIAGVGSSQVRVTIRRQK